MDIQKGDWIKVPKGTPLAKDYTKGNYGRGEPTSRDVVVQVSFVTPIDEYEFKNLLSVEDYQVWREELKKCGNSYACGPDHTDETRARAKADRDAAYQNALSKIPNGATHMVCWSNDKKGVQDIFAEKVPAPPPKKKAELKINKRQQMVDKSRWKFTADHDVTYAIPNPLIHQGEALWEEANPRPLNTGGTMDQDMAWRELVFAERKRLEDLHGKTIVTVHREVKAGEIFTVVGKFQTYNPYGYGAEDCGIIARVLFDGDTKQSFLPYKQIVDLIEADSIPTVNIYVLRNKATGLFYQPSTYDDEATEKARLEKLSQLGMSSQDYVHVDYVYTDNATDQFMKAKHFDGLGRAKTQILMMTGYYNDLPGADEALPEWAGGSASFEMSDDWELAHFDKLARKELGVVEDFQQWFKRSWELRALTVKYGSSVRTVYKALEKANLLDTQKGMIVFKVTDQNKLDKVNPYEDKTAVMDEDVKAIEQAVIATGAKKGSFKKAVDGSSMAVSFASKGAAMIFKLAYSGDLKTIVIDLEDMKETVDG